MNTKASRAFATQLLFSALVALGAGGGLGFAIVDLRHDISVSANNARVIEQRVIEAERRIGELGGAIATGLSPDALVDRNQSLALGLVQPDEARVVHVAGSAAGRLAAKRQAEIFAAGDGRIILPVRFTSGGAQR